MSEPLVLATDLDGTMAHGTADAREELLRALRGAGQARLIYVTGRTPESARMLLRQAALPAPELLIADVGTSVLHGAGPDRVVEIEAELAAGWPGADAIRERLQRVTTLTPQDVHAPRRVAYWIEPVRVRRARAATTADPFAARAPADASFDAESAGLARSAAAEAAAALRPLPVDVLLSGNVFLDVLPRGVNKGSTLQRVLRWLGVAGSACVVAGDSLNDLALFETGLRGITVGNCEPALAERVAGMAHVYRAHAEGAAGILEGLRHHGRVGEGSWREGHDGQ